MIETILFICTGNTCRSIMAEGIFKKMLRDKKRNNSGLNIISAGISALPGMRPTLEAMKVMREQGIDISPHTATQVQDDLIKKSDLILVMSNAHKNRFTFARDKIYLLRKFAQVEKIKKLQEDDKNYEIVDPLGRSIGFYRIIAKQLRENLEKILNKILDENNK